MRRILTALVIILLLTLVNSTYGMTIPNEIKKIVTFIFIQDKYGKIVPQGTGFFVGVKCQDNPDISFGYLVTAKHVLQNEDKTAFLSTVYIRLNKKDNGSDLLRLDLILSGKNKNVFTHDDPSVDIAIVPTVPNDQKYDFRFLPEDFITKKDDFQKFNITEGSEVFFTGLFTPYIGNQRNNPIVRFGKLALVTDEKIDFGGVKADLYLMEASSYGGNSGSPVYFYLGIDRNPGSVILGNPVLKLAGIVSGRFNDIIPVQAIQTDVIPAVNPNTGIACVVPAYKIYDILFSDEMLKFRSSKSKLENKN